VVAPQPLCDLGEFKRFWYAHIAPTTGDLGDPEFVTGVTGSAYDRIAEFETEFKIVRQQVHS